VIVKRVIHSGRFKMKKPGTGMDRRAFLKKAGLGSIALASLPALSATAALAEPVAAGGPAQYLRWDIIHLGFTSPLFTFTPGGFASAFSDASTKLKITFTGAGTFVAPASGGSSNAVTGGGTWEIFKAGVSIEKGTYKVTELVVWVNAGHQDIPPDFIDLIGDNTKRTNGTSVLRIAYSDGSVGTLGVGCHGPHAPDGIQEGIIATKGYLTFWTIESPVAGADGDRTLYHLLRG
jgi:hypothetical protein